MYAGVGAEFLGWERECDLHSVHAVFRLLAIFPASLSRSRWRSRERRSIERCQAMVEYGSARSSIFTKFITMSPTSTDQYVWSRAVWGVTWIMPSALSLSVPRSTPRARPRLLR